jgi:hypothetical protein
LVQKATGLVKGDMLDGGEAFWEDRANESDERCRVMEVKIGLGVEMCNKLGISM